MMNEFEKTSRISRPRNKKMNLEFAELSKKAGPHSDKVGKHAPRHRAGKLSEKEILESYDDYDFDYDFDENF